MSCKPKVYSDGTDQCAQREVRARLGICRTSRRPLSPRQPLRPVSYPAREFEWPPTTGRGGGDDLPCIPTNPHSLTKRLPSFSRLRLPNTRSNSAPRDAILARGLVLCRISGSLNHQPCPWRTPVRIHHEAPWHFCCASRTMTSSPYSTGTLVRMPA